jgi:N-acetyl-alpha-D-glucosaminyl L-malate synthase BshA
MKIGIACYPSVGGSGMVGTRLAIELSRKGHEVHMFSSDIPFLMQNYPDSGVKFHQVTPVAYPLFSKIGAAYSYAEASKMIEVVNKEKLDVIHTHYAIPHALAATLVKQITFTPVICTVHGSDVHTVGLDPSYKPIVEHTLKHQDKITTVSNYLKDVLLECYSFEEENVDVIYNFVDTVHHNPNHQHCELLSEFEHSITHASNFRKIKNIPFLIRSFSKVLEEFPSAVLLLAGDGPEKKYCEELVRDLSIQKNVIFRGILTDLNCFFAHSSLVAMPSTLESFGLILTEAMSSGTPVVASRVGGIPEVVEDGKQGILFSPHNEKECVEAITNILGDNQLRKKMGDSGRERVLKQFSIEHILPQYEKLYEKTIEDVKNRK